MGDCSELKSSDGGMELGSLSGIQYYLSEYGENDPYYYVGSKIMAKDKESRACPSSKCEPKANCLLPICCFS